MFDDLDIPISQLLGSPGPKAAIVATIGPQLADALEALGHSCQHQRRSVAIADVRSVNLQRQDQAQCINHQVTFTSIDVSAAIKAALWPADIGCLDTLTVNDRRTRLSLASQTPSHSFAQCRMDRFPDAQQAPQAEVYGRRF